MKGAPELWNKMTFNEFVFLYHKATKLAIDLPLFKYKSWDKWCKLAYLADHKQFFSFNHTIFYHGMNSLSDLCFIVVHGGSIDVSVPCSDGCLHSLCHFTWRRLERKQHNIITKKRKEWEKLSGKERKNRNVMGKKREMKWQEREENQNETNNCTMKTVFSFFPQYDSTCGEQQCSFFFSHLV